MKDFFGSFRLLLFESICSNSSFEYIDLSILSRRTAFSRDRDNPVLILSRFVANSSIPKKDPSRSGSHEADMIEYVIPYHRSDNKVMAMCIEIIEKQKRCRRKGWKKEGSIQTRSNDSTKFCQIKMMRWIPRRRVVRLCDKRFLSEANLPTSKSNKNE